MAQVESDIQRRVESSVPEIILQLLLQQEILFHRRKPLQLFFLRHVPPHDHPGVTAAREEDMFMLLPRLHHLTAIACLRRLNRKIL